MTIVPTHGSDAVAAVQCEALIDPREARGVTERSARLDQALLEIKSHTFGIDESLERVIQAVRPWYLTRMALPTVIGVWGPPSGGKTSTILELARRLEAQLVYLDANKLAEANTVDYQWNSVRVDPFLHSFVREVPLEGQEEFGFSTTFFVPRFTIPNNLAVFLDEIQSVRTRGPMGDEIIRSQLQIFFEILASGGFAVVPNVEYRAVQDQIKEAHGYLPYRYADDLKMTKDDVKRRNTQVIAWLERRLAETPKQIRLDFRRTLFVVGGNLFSLFPSNLERSPSGIPVEDRHARDSAITATDVTAALYELFQPQQVSRFGVTHVIFPSLSTAGLRRLIEFRIDELEKKLAEHDRITLRLTPAFRDRLYRELLVSGAEPRGLFGIFASFLGQPLTRAVEAIYRSAGDPNQLRRWEHLEITGEADGRASSARWQLRRDYVLLETWNSAIPSIHASLHNLEESPERERRALRVAARLVVESIRHRRRAEEVWVNAMGSSLGSVEFRDLPAKTARKISTTRGEAMEEIVSLVGPRVAELMVLGEGTDATSVSLQRASLLAKDLITDHAFAFGGGSFVLTRRRDMEIPLDGELFGEVNRVIEEAFTQASEQLNRERRFLRAVTERLTEVATLDRRELERLYEAHWAGPPLDANEVEPAKDLRLLDFMEKDGFELALPDRSEPIGF